MAAAERLCRAGPTQQQQRLVVPPASALSLHRRHAPARRRPAAPPTAALPPAASLRLMAASPFDQIDSQMAAFDRQFLDMQRQMDQDMDFAFRQMDRAMDRSFREVQQMQRQLDQDLARAARDAAEAAAQQLPRVRIERSEQRGIGSYRYYEHIEIRTGPMATLAPSLQSAPPTPMFSPLLAAALVLGAAWAGVAALLARNFSLTTFKEASKARMALSWPYLAAFNKRFRTEMWSALRGRKVQITREDPEGGAAGGVGNGRGGEQ